MGGRLEETWIDASQALIDCQRRPCKQETAAWLGMYTALSSAMHDAPDSKRKRELQMQLDDLYTRSGLARCAAGHCASIAYDKAVAELRYANGKCRGRRGRPCSQLSAWRAAVASMGRPPTERQLGDAFAGAFRNRSAVWL